MVKTHSSALAFAMKVSTIRFLCPLISIDVCRLWIEKTHTWPNAGRISMFLKTTSGAGMVLSGGCGYEREGEVFRVVQWT